MAESTGMKHTKEQLYWAHWQRASQIQAATITLDIGAAGTGSPPSSRSGLI